MSEETILILNMLRDGKLSVDEAERLLNATTADAARPEPPPPPPTPPWVTSPPPPPSPGAPPRRPSPPPPPPSSNAPFAHIVSAVQSRLGDLQGKLGTIQGDLLAAAASKAEENGDQGKAGWNKSDFGSVLDETVRDLNVLKEEALRAGRRAVREAAVQGRAAANEARRAARRAGAEFRSGMKEGSFTFRWSERPHNHSGMPEASDTVTIEEVIGEDDTVTILNPLGQVTLTGGGPAGRISGELKRSVWAGTRDEAEYALASVRAVVRTEGGGFTLEITAPAETQDATADLELTVPTGVAVSVQTVHGDIRAQGVSAAFSARTQAGDIDAADGIESEGDASFFTSSGDITVKGWSLTAGGISVESSSGDVRLTDIQATAICRIASQSGDILLDSFKSGELDGTSASGDIRLVSGTLDGEGSVRSQSGCIRVDDVTAARISTESISGDLSLRNLTARLAAATTSGDAEVVAVQTTDLSLKTVSGDADVSVNAPFTGSLTANTVSGDLEVTLPPVTGAWVDAATTSGEIESKLRLEDQQAGDSRRVAGRLGDGSGTVRVRSISGDVSLSQQI